MDLAEKWVVLHHRARLLQRPVPALEVRIVGQLKSAALALGQALSTKYPFPGDELDTVAAEILKGISDYLAGGLREKELTGSEASPALVRRQVLRVLPEVDPEVEDHDPAPLLEALGRHLASPMSLKEALREQLQGWSRLRRC